jgi:hypothetical protein
VLDTAFAMQVHVGCQVVQPIHDDDCAVSFELMLPPGTSLTALVEYSS